MREYRWIAEELFTVTEFLSREECQSYIGLGESLGFTEAPIDTGFGQELVKEMRDNSRVIRDDPALAEKLWTCARDYVPDVFNRSQAVGLNERFRFYRTIQARFLNGTWMAFFAAQTGNAAS